MDNALRPTGIEGVGDQPWGSHFCLFYETKDDLIDLLVPYLIAGLENQEFCLCVASEPVVAEEAERALRRAVPDFDRHLAHGQIEIVSHQHWYLADGRFDPLRVRQGWVDKLEQGLARGYAGMRFAANVFWLERQDWDRFAEYERMLDEVFGKLPILAVCAYALARCSSADMLDVVRHHQFSLARRHGIWERLEGPELRRALGEVRRLNSELERRITDATAQLVAANDKLQAEIAERRQAEVQLRLLIDTIPAMVFTASPDGFVDYVNERWRQFLGLPLERVQGWNWEATIHPDDRARSVEHWRSTMASGQAAENELRVRRADGEYRGILGRFVPLRNAFGTIVRWYGVSTDIDDRKRAEQAVRESQQLLHRVLATLPVGVAVTDHAGDIMLANAASKRIWGHTIVSGRERWAQSKGYWHDSGKCIEPESWASVRALTDGQTSLNELIDIETFDGRQRTIQNSAAPIRNAEGLIVGAVIVNEDVTERVRAEKALRESAERLQHLSRRLLEVQEAERRHLARELHDDVGQVLTGLQLMLKADGDLTPDAVRARFEQARGVVGELLERVRRLSFDLRPAGLDRLGLLPALLALGERYTGQTGVAVSFKQAGLERRFAPEVETAAYRIVQEALTNVARHARVREAVVRLWADAETLRIQVEDQGAGFDPAAALAAGRSGGLAGMHERVALLGGRLTVEAIPGGGTHVLAELPLAGPTGGPSGEPCDHPGG